MSAIDTQYFNFQSSQGASTNGQQLNVNYATSAGKLGVTHGLGVTINVTGWYDISAYGAEGGAADGGEAPGGLGAAVGGDVYLTAGTVLEIVVGGEGAAGGGATFGFGGGGGGGGSFVFGIDPTTGVESALVVAGGGGGGGAAGLFYVGLGVALATTDGGQFLGVSHGANGVTGTHGAAGAVDGGLGGAGGLVGASTTGFKWTGGAPGHGGFGGTGAAGGGGGGFEGGAAGLSGVVGPLPELDNFAGGGGAGGGGHGGFGGGGQGGIFPGGGGGGWGGGGGGSVQDATLLGVGPAGTTGITAGGGGGGGSFISAGAHAATNPPNGITGPNGLVTISYVGAALCFVAGGRILTERGEVAVEDLVIGDRAVTASGAARPIRWTGHRRLDRPAPDHWPVRVKAGAFGENLPARDLWLSPGHAVCVGVLDEVFVPIGLLVNGTTIAQLEVPEVTYWHVELESHEVLLAEGLPCESYMDTGARAFFGRQYGRLEAVDPVRVARSLTRYARPFVNKGPVVEAIRRRLADLAEPVRLARAA